MKFTNFLEYSWLYYSYILLLKKKEKKTLYVCLHPFFASMGWPINLKLHMGIKNHHRRRLLKPFVSFTSCPCLFCVLRKHLSTAAKRWTLFSDWNCLIMLRQWLTKQIIFLACLFAFLANCTNMSVFCMRLWHI